MNSEFAFMLSHYFFTAYFFEVFSIYMHQFILGKNMFNFAYFIPLIIISIFTVLLYISKKFSESFHCLIHVISGLYLGYILYIFQFAVVLRLILIFYSLPKVISFCILYIGPILVNIYGIKNGLATKIQEVTLKYPGFKNKVKILHLSDIHLGAFYQTDAVQMVVNETKKINPDIVVITGDLADGSLKVKTEWLMPFNELNVPILYVTGNHEEMNPTTDMIQCIKETNIKYIGNHEHFMFKGVNFIGEDYGYDLHKVLKDIKCQEGVPNVLLSHVPCLSPEQSGKYNIFLFLAGHTHGGQNFPFHIPTYLGNACFAGLYSSKNKKSHVYVSEGVNPSLLPIKVGCYRTFPVITIEGEN